MVKMSLRPFCLSAGVSNVHKATNIPLLCSDKERVCETQSFLRGPLPHSVYLGRH